MHHASTLLAATPDFTVHKRSKPIKAYILPILALVSLFVSTLSFAICAGGLLRISEKRDTLLTPSGWYFLMTIVVAAGTMTIFIEQLVSPQLPTRWTITYIVIETVRQLLLALWPIFLISGLSALQWLTMTVVFGCSMFEVALTFIQRPIPTLLASQFNGLMATWPLTLFGMSSLSFLKTIEGNGASHSEDDVAGLLIITVTCSACLLVTGLTRSIGAPLLFSLYLISLLSMHDNTTGTAAPLCTGSIIPLLLIQTTVLGITIAQTLRGPSSPQPTRRTVQFDTSSFSTSFNYVI
ncbi:TMP-1 protein [Giardia muris]|uniref:TMP-1 protein n=1 Tax=Giardia muris TaxID=5742 RepID=A0A4Z1SRV4_GIAMU|nr:TMP-1 protein [Giardia muris]|eukprot:TNJ26368.1 TMP-1 protein [Giardia muris]